MSSHGSECVVLAVALLHVGQESKAFVVQRRGCLPGGPLCEHLLDTQTLRVKSRRVCSNQIANYFTALENTGFSRRLLDT